MRSLELVETPVRAVRSLLTISADAKTIKGEPLGYRTAVCYLAPASISGANVCASSTAGCRAACLYTAGRGAFTATQEARVARTLLYWQDRLAFMARLVRELDAFIRATDHAGLVPAVRLNGTSDIRWETVPVNGAPNIMALYPRTQFYDYTKHANRRLVPRNYHLTYSLAEGERSWRGHLLALETMNVAVVLSGAGDSRYPRPFPRTWNGRRLIDGDTSDLRFIDRPRRGAYVGLRAKGQARGDASGFVYNVEGVAA